MNEALARQIFDVVIGEAQWYGAHIALNFVDALSLEWPSYPWLDWASDWEHEQLAKRYAA